VFNFYGVRTTGYYCLTSYHSSIVKVLVPRAVFYLLVPSLSRAFQEIKPPMFSSNFWSTSASLVGFPAGLASRTVQLLWICFLKHISQRQPILPPSTVLSRGLRTSFWWVFLPIWSVFFCLTWAGGPRNLAIWLLLVCPAGRNLFVTYNGLNSTAIHHSVKGF